MLPNFERDFLYFYELLWSATPYTLTVIFSALLLYNTIRRRRAARSSR